MEQDHDGLDDGLDFLDGMTSKELVDKLMEIESGLFERVTVLNGILRRLNVEMKV